MVTEEELINLIDNGDLEQAIGVYPDILEKHVIREGLYFKMYIAWQIGEKIRCRNSRNCKVFIRTT